MQVGSNSLAFKDFVNDLVKGKGFDLYSFFLVYNKYDLIFSLLHCLCSPDVFVLLLFFMQYFYSRIIYNILFVYVHKTKQNNKNKLNSLLVLFSIHLLNLLVIMLMNNTTL